MIAHGDAGGRAGRSPAGSAGSEPGVEQSGRGDGCEEVTFGYVPCGERGAVVVVRSCVVVVGNRCRWCVRVGVVGCREGVNLVLLTVDGRGRIRRSSRMR